MAAPTRDYQLQYTGTVVDDEAAAGTWPYPFPNGWYLIAPGSQLRPQHVIQKTWMGREIVAWRDGEGTVCVADAYCPHLGSHLGPQGGGMVRAGNLVCPFHGFEFDTTGRCTATPLAPPPKSARLTTYPVQETNGFIFAYWNHAGHEPTWHIPKLTDGWHGRRLIRRRLRAHPQITTENSVDFGHLGYIHGYHELKQSAPTTIEGPCLTSCYSFTRHMLTRGLRWVRFPIDIRISVWGLGLSVVDIHSAATGLQMMQWVLAVPVAGQMLDLWLAIDPAGWLRLPGVGRLPKWISHGIVPRILLHELELDVMKDAGIWARQRYEPRPVLSKGDQDVYRFRRYSQQFYPPAAAPTAAQRHK